MWETPLYKYSVGGRKMIIDVTLSAPSFDRPAAIVSELIPEFKRKNFKHILDFGAGRLRNTLPFLQSGSQVSVVEYRQQFEHSFAAQNLERARSYGNFGALILPHEFPKTKVKFDAILFMYVANIIPAPKERELIIRYCYDKLETGGNFVWVTQGFNTWFRSQMSDKNRLNDGWVFNLSRERQTFYTEFSAQQIDRMVAKHGFELEKRIEFGKTPSRLYRKID